MRSFTHTRLGLLLLMLLVACSSGLGLAATLRGVARAYDPPHIWLSNKVAPPTTSVLLNGGGFGQREMVNVDFDASLIATAVTDTTGKFAVRITIPKMALPGSHTIQATGQTSGFTAQTAFLVQTDWAEFHFGPYHTGNNPYENVINSSNVSKLTLDWSYTTGGGIGSSPAVVNSIVYVGSDHRLYALDAMTGTLKWSYTTGGNVSSPAMVNGIVYVCSGYPDSKLYALDAITGTFKWSYTVAKNGISSDPAVANGIIYAISNSGEMYALNALTGTFKWRRYYTGYLASSPAVANGVIYSGSRVGKLYALDAVTGVLKWSYSTSGSIESSPAVVNGVVYVGSWDSNIYAFHLPNMS